MVKYLRGRMRVARPSPRKAWPRISAAAVTTTCQQPEPKFVLEHNALTSQQDVCALEGISEHVKIAGGEDEGDGGEERDGCSTGVFPLRKLAPPIS
jgi:hypothetical protein